MDDTAPIGNYTDDMEDEASGNYDYDAIGNLKKDVKEEINNIEWTISGKVKKVTRISTSTKPDLEFVYDAMGNRIEKIVKPAGTLATPNSWTTTYYVSDAQGNVMATYTKGYNSQTQQTTFTLNEKNIFGSSRLGVRNTTTDMLASFSASSKLSRTLGLKNYEFSNHLGNVLITANDRKLGIDVDGLSDSQGRKHVESYSADVLSYNDYYAFGSEMPGRNGGASGYKCGFNGKESDSEWDGGGSMYDYGFRIYNPRLGKFLSVDPLTKSYPWYTPYQFAGNKPIQYVDIDGLEEGLNEVYFWVRPLLGNGTAGQLADGYIEIHHQEWLPQV